MAITESQLQRLKRELTEDLEAIKRVEEIMARHNGSSHTTGTPVAPPITNDVQMPLQRLINVKHGMGRGALISTVVDALKAAYPNPMRPRELVDLVLAKGFKFSSDEVAASSVSTALQRLYKRDGRIERHDGAYTWKPEKAE